MSDTDYYKTISNVLTAKKGEFADRAYQWLKLQIEAQGRQAPPRESYGTIGWTWIDPGRADLVISDFRFKDQQRTPSKSIIAENVFRNDSPGVTIQKQFNYSTTYTDTFSYGFTEGLTVGTKATIKAGIPFFVSGRVEVSAQISFGASQTVTTTKAEAFSNTLTITVNPNTQVRVVATLSQWSGVTGFTASAALDASRTPYAQVSWALRDGGASTGSIPLDVLLPNHSDWIVPVSGTMNADMGFDAEVETTPITTR
jgi:hypothetical protein